MSPDEAIHIVALHLVHRIVEDADDHWETYPDIGEGDWRKIDGRLVSLLGPMPRQERFDEAYRLLADRAEDLGP